MGGGASACGTSGVRPGVRQTLSRLPLPTMSDDPRNAALETKVTVPRFWWGESMGQYLHVVFVLQTSDVERLGGRPNDVSTSESFAFDWSVDKRSVYP